MSARRQQPESARILLGLLRDHPVPEDIEIAVLRVEDDESDESNLSSADKYPRNAFAKQGAHLGLNAFDLPKLARDFRDDYRSIRSDFRRAHRQHTGNDPDDDKEQALSSQIIDATTCLLVLCPDHATAWSDRKRALSLMERQCKCGRSEDRSSGALCFVSELNFLDILFSQHSKAPNSWTHRKWICRKIVNGLTFSASNERSTRGNWETLQTWAGREIDVCTRVAEKFPKNYYAWTHRSFVVQLVITSCFANGCPRIIEPVTDFLSEELTFSKSWLSTHISDHSAVHYGSETLRKIFAWYRSISCADVATNRKNACRRSCLAEAKLALSGAGDLCSRYASHEAIWIWRRLCATVVIEILSSVLGYGHVSPANVDAELRDFVQNEVLLLSEEKIENSLDCRDLRDGNEDRSMRVHSLTYILWVLDQLKRHNCNIWCSDLDVLHQSLVEKLARKQCIASNLWRVQC
mmetsp:Transcript_4109/g.11309  ORF Transcript_4109/g.11309 Transcript_4109/m.11309 type:complete len:465 (-) Transcript_4109:64-1458(-)